MNLLRKVYGIDFGTSNSAVGFVNNQNKPELVPLDHLAEKPNVMRTVIYVSIKGEFEFGEKAIQSYNKDVALAKAAEKKTVRTGNLIKVTSDASATSGYKPDKIVEQIFESEEVNTGRLLQGIKSILANKSIDEITIFEKIYKIEELVGIYLSEIKKRADEYTGHDVRKVVLGRPVNFVGGNNKLAVKRLMKAAKLAGFKNIELQMEPIGAAYDYGIDINTNSICMVFDFGGGTLDLSIVKFPDKKIIINSGIPLGGDLINSKLFYEQFAKHFGKGERYGDKKLQMPETLYMQLQNWYAISLMKTKAFFDSIELFSYLHSNETSLGNLKELVKDNLGFNLYEEIDRVKKNLSENQQESFNLDFSASKITDLLSREKFEKIIENDLIKIQDLINNTLKDSKLKSTQIDNIVLTGGSSLIPAVRRLLIVKFGKEKLREKDSFTSVASGLALYGEKVFGE